MSELQYKGYKAVARYEPDVDMFGGHVIGISSVITFYADTVENLKHEFKTSVDEYLAICEERGIKPEKEYSGKFMVRTDPELHKQIAQRAEVSGKSVNAWITEALIERAQREA
jgi:predicted HicB family RNase H-like nuclease